MYGLMIPLDSKNISVAPFFLLCICSDGYIPPWFSAIVRCSRWPSTSQADYHGRLDWPAPDSPASRISAWSTRYHQALDSFGRLAAAESPWARCLPPALDPLGYLNIIPVLNYVPGEKHRKLRYCYAAWSSVSPTDLFSHDLITVVVQVLTSVSTF